MTRSPAASSAGDGASPSPYPATRPSAKAIQPWSITRSARTILALPITVSELAESIFKYLSSCRAGERCHVDDAVCNKVAHLVGMNDRHHGDVLPFLLADQFDHDRAVGRIERGGRLVQQQDREGRGGTPGAG